MKALKKTIIEDLLGRINASPFLVVVDYQTATVAEFEALRGKLGEASAEIHVTKNAYMKRVAKDAELPEELNDALRGQTAIVTGESDICAAAKALKDFNKETGKVAVRSGGTASPALTSRTSHPRARTPTKTAGQMSGMARCTGRAATKPS